MDTNIKPSKNVLSNRPDFFLIGIIIGIIVSFLIWANFTQLNLVTRGMGRVVAIGENKSIQAPESGVVSNYYVVKGQKVKANEIVAIINRTEAEGVLEEVNTRLNNLSIRLYRIDAEIRRNSIEELRSKLETFSGDIVANELEIFKARFREMETKIRELSNEKEKYEKQSEILNAELKGLKDLKVLILDEIQEIFPLVKEGVIGKAEKYRLEREISGVKTEIQTMIGKQAQNHNEIEKIREAILAFKEKNVRDLYELRSDTMGEILELKAKIPTLSQRLTELEIRSPIDGEVNRVFFNNKGAVLRAGDIMAEIVPTTSGVQIEAFIDPKDIGFIEPGQQAKVSLTAYDASKYGYLEGLLKQITPDTVFREETNSAQYSVIISIKNKLLDSENNEVDIYPGMIAQVDIIRGNRTILEYFWQPVAKIKDTAFKE